jgi:hypothetical protein
MDALSGCPRIAGLGGLSGRVYVVYLNRDGDLDEYDLDHVYAIRHRLDPVLGGYRDGDGLR